MSYCERFMPVMMQSLSVEMGVGKAFWAVLQKVLIQGDGHSLQDILALVWISISRLICKKKRKV